MSNNSNYQGFDKEAKLNAEVIKNVGKAVGKAGKDLFKVPENGKYISKSLKELEENISKSGLKTKKPIDELMKENTKTDFGLSGLLADGVKAGVKAGGKKAYKVMPKSMKKKVDNNILTPTNKKRVSDFNKAVTDKRNKFDKGIADLDMKLGGFGYKHAPGKTKKLFTGTQRVEIEPKNKSGAKEYADFKVTKISQPVRKVRDFAIPIAGGMYVSDKLEKLKYQTPEAKALNEISHEKTSSYNEDALIDKVSFMLENKGVRENTNNSAQDFSYYLNKMSKLASQASTQLILASNEKKSLMEKISQLEVEKSLIKIAYENEARERDAKELATEMIEKGLIKKANYEDKVKDLYKMDKQSFEVFRKTIDDISIEKHAADCEYGVDSLQFILGNSSPSGRVSMEEAFSQY